MSTTDPCTTATTTSEPALDQSGLPAVPVNDPPPPYPSHERRTRALRSSRRPAHRTIPIITNSVSSPESDHTAEHRGHHTHAFPGTDATETTPLLNQSSPISSARRLSWRPRSNSHSSTIISSNSCAPSLAHTVFSLFHDSDDEGEVDIYEALADERFRHRDRAQDSGPGQSAIAQDVLHRGSGRWPLFSRRAWSRYFRPMGRKAYHAATFHLMVVNFPYALIAWIYLFVFTLTGTTLLITLPLGAVLCFLDLLGARAFARGELALQTKFHGPLAYPPPYPSRPIFQRTRPPRLSGVENGGEPGVQYETSFYKNTYAMFTDATTYQALFYFLVIKPGITLLISIALVVLVPVSYVLVLPAPLMLRFVRKLGIWQANVAVEGLYYAVS
ncbi:hypothetical protein HYDPIDRAFT_83573 [Hydnomerulius pinastri MD-312]|nr:hypothetical protein HYDPIDRAFT_83573 [Hydnomerulius pinastri MD-312]